MRIDSRRLALRAEVGAAAHRWGRTPLRSACALLAAWALLVAACSDDAAPAARTLSLGADFSSCATCSAVEVALLRGDPPTCTLARATVTLPTQQAGPQLPAPDGPVTVAAWATCSASAPPPPSPNPTDPTQLCASAVQACAGQLGSNLPTPDASLLAALYDGLCRAENATPLQQCCAALLPCLATPAATCEAELAECARLLNLQYVPGQIDLAQLKQLAQGYCQQGGAPSAECCAALGACVNGSPGSPPGTACVACRALQRVDLEAYRELILEVQRAQSCERPAVLDLPDC